MAATIPNIAKGRMNQFVHSVENDDPTGARFEILLLIDTGLDTIDQLRDMDTVTAIKAGNTECSVASYDRITLTASDISVPTVDDSGNQQTWDIGDFDFGALESGQSIQAAVVAYFPATASDDDDGIPCHITRLDTAIPLNGEVFHFRTPNGLWAATEPA